MNDKGRSIMGQRGTRPAPSARLWQARATLLTTGCCALALGLFVYATDRDPASALLFPAIAALHVGALFGAAGAWLPSFIHPFAFSLFSAAAMPREANPPYRVCAGWWALNIAFEVAQHPRFSGTVATAFHGVFGDTLPGRVLANYVQWGSFDAADLVAVTAGSLAAAAVLLTIHRKEARHAN